MSGWYQSGGAQLHYLDTGAGLPVVFLHPTPLDHDYWRPLVGELGRQTGSAILRAIAPVRAIVPDLRGHGSSQLGQLAAGAFELVPDAPVLTMQQLAADVL